MERPILCLVAGHNGAGKTNLCEEVLAHRTAAPFVNADRLALERFGHPAVTEEEARYGQAVADRVRDALLAGRRSLMTEALDRRSPPSGPGPASSSAGIPSPRSAPAAASN